MNTNQNLLNQLKNAKRSYSPQDIEEYYERLRKKQKEHLDGIKFRGAKEWRPCLHDSCEQCCGTGRKKDGTTCLHMISCPCPKCSPHFM